MVRLSPLDYNTILSRLLLFIQAVRLGRGTLGILQRCPTHFPQTWNKDKQHNKDGRVKDGGGYLERRRYRQMGSDQVSA
jgi:hypothetical protein